MARRTQDREDLLNEATALLPRILLQLELDGRAVEVFAGFRNGEALSLYFDSDPVFHFNSRGELRRAFAEGRILKAEQGKLVAWRPQRTAKTTSMTRKELTPDEQRDFGSCVNHLLRSLNDSIKEQQYTLMGQVPEAGDALERIGVWVQNQPGFKVAAKANLL